MAISMKASVGHRVVSALLALLCGLFLVALPGSSLLPGWYGITAAIVTLFGAYAFGHVAVRGTLPGHFQAGGNAFMGSQRSKESNDSYRSTPTWQRATCGALATGGGIAIAAGLANGHYWASLQSVVSLAFALGGTYLFGYIALRGRLPRPYPRGGNGTLDHHQELGP